MKVLVINAGSSSLKYQLMDMSDESVLAKGLCERIGIDGRIIHKLPDGRKVELDCNFPTHTEAFEKLTELLTTGEYKVVDSLKEIDAVGHRMVHGGEKFTKSEPITDELLAAYDALSDLAPLHNPAGVKAVKACQSVFGKDVPMVGVFDTAFHQTMPAKAYTYPVPYEYYEKYGVRRYGFHGTSHRYVSARLAELMGKDIKDLKIITCHLGNGSSITAVDGGKSVDTTMGFTPLDGLIMGTRSGSVDPSILNYICEKEGKSIKDVTNMLNKKSGMEGVSGVSSDMREVIAAAEQGNERAQLTVDILAYQIKKYIGGFAAAMGGLDAILFTGGIGENDASLRYNVCSNMEILGIKVCKDCCEKASRKEMKFSTDDSKVECWVVPTDEELLIARDTRDIVSAL
ncbi:MAG: acetate kinase [Oscillospiraceae bacterium]|nr:MAG: acetate kinase [Oscillospiraceae bacterium]